MNEFMIGAIIGSLISGAVVGAIPAICGAVKHKIGLAIGGFFACVVASFLLGLILAIPVCALFLFLIFKKNKKNNEKSSNFPCVMHRNVIHRWKQKTTRVGGFLSWCFAPTRMVRKTGLAWLRVGAVPARLLSQLGKNVHWTLF